MQNEYTMANGMFRLGFFASSPVAAKLSNPTKQEKHFAAPAATPATPYGMKPPSPPRTPCGISSFCIVQLAKLAVLDGNKPLNRYHLHSYGR